MIGALRRYVRARVARRMFLVFVAVAFVPLAAISVLSLVQVRSLLLQQGEQRLAGSAKAYAMLLFERLLVAGDLAGVTAAGKGAAPGADSAESRTFRSLVVADSDGRRRVILGADDGFALGAEEVERVASGKPQVRVSGGSARPRVDIVVPVPGLSGVQAIAEIRPEFLWGPADELPAMTDFCIIEDRWRTVIHCSAPMPAAVLEGAAAWDKDGEPQRARSWTQFLRAAFGTPDWTVVASQPESVLLARAKEFARTYVPIMVLALLLVLWFTIRSSRDIAVPVARLADRARGVGGRDFAARVDLQREDELGALANAFDQMSDRLKRQFSTLEGLSEIDRLILTTQDTAQVIQTVLRRLAEVSTADAHTVLVFDGQATDHARTYHADGMDRHELSASDRKVLSGAASEWPGLADAVAPTFLKRVQEAGMASAYVQPITWRGTSVGALVLGFREARTPSDDERRATAELGDRVAVAVSSAWRDQQLYQQSHFDTVTGAPNRLLFLDRLALEVVRSSREGLKFGLLFVDLDHFKTVNDSYGHTTGDAVLREAAERISRVVRSSDSLARLGGDEFTVLLPNLQNVQEAFVLGESIVEALSREFVVGEHRCFLSASVGIASYPDDGITAEALLKSADTAMYRAKAAGRAQVVFFEERMNQEAVARIALDRDLRVAIERGELELHYQPQGTVRGLRVTGAEALVRWKHPVHGYVPPVRFIPVAEESGFIEAIGQWVIREACRQVAAWRDAGLDVPHVAVNVSPRQFRRRGLVEYLGQCVHEAGIPPRSLHVEITEGVLMERSESSEALLRSIADQGHPIALDDFGTGFSSMAYLRRFPVDTIKIDRAFVDGLAGGAESGAIAAAIVAMGHALGKRIVAEGVETAEQLAALEALGCDEIQGWYFSKALPADQFEAFARSRLPTTVAA